MARTYGRVYNEQQTPRWVVVTTDPQGFDDYVWATTLIQTLKLSLNESPFYGNYGIPGQQSVVQQVIPDYYVAITQAQYAGYFSNLAITRISAQPPTYRVNVTLQNGVALQQHILDGENYQYFAVDGQGGTGDGGNPVIVG